MQTNGMKSNKQIRRERFHREVYENIKDLSQPEIEKYWSDSEYKAEVQIYQEMFLAELDDKLFDRARASIMVNDIDDLLSTFIKYVWIEENQTESNKYPGSKLIDPSEAIVFMAKSKAFKQTDIHISNAIESMTEFIVALDRILFDFVPHVIKVDDPNIADSIDDKGKMFVTKTYMKIDFITNVDESEFLFSEDFPLPIIGEPKDWIEGERGGGYHLSDEKVTLKLGNADQPQNVLDVLNKMQRQEFYVGIENANEKYKEYIVKTQAKRLGITEEQARESSKVKDVIKNSTTTLKLHLDILDGKCFKFQWKYDFRGRIYNTGYNVHLQSDKFKKGMLVPCHSNFDKTYELIEK